MYVTTLASMIFVSINTSVFSGNQAVIGPFGGGGALYSSGGVLNLGNNTFIGNAANGYGGAIAYSYECASGNRLCRSPHTSHMLVAAVVGVAVLSDTQICQVHSTVSNACSRMP